MWALPRSAVVGGREYELHTDYRDVLEVVAALNGGQAYVALCLFYDGWLEHGRPEHAEEALRRMAEFVACGIPEGNGGARPVRLIDWEQDEPLIAAGINRAAGVEVRALPYLHWFTFIGYYMSIGDGPLAAVAAIRDKRARGEKLDKWEQAFYRQNRALVDLRPALTDRERAEKERLLKMLDSQREGERHERFTQGGGLV